MKSVSLREIIMFGAVIILSFFLICKKWNNSQLEQDKARKDERIKMYEQNEIVQHHTSDSLKTKISEFESLLKQSKKDTIVIIKKYEKVRNNVNLLDADQSISYLTERLSKKSSTR